MDLQFWPGAVVIVFVATLVVAFITSGAHSAWFVGALLFRVVSMPDIDFDQESALAVPNRGSASVDGTWRRDDRKSRPSLFRLEFACEHYG